MADNFGLKIGLEGEKEFKNALRDINQSFKVLGSEMTLVASQFDKNDKSVQAVTARNAVLNKEIDAQREKITTLKAALDNAASSFGENDTRTQNWQIQLNKAQAELNGMERELEQSTIEADKLGDELDDSGKSAEDAGGRFEKLGGVLKGIGVAMGAVAVAAGAAAIKLGKEVVQQFGELEQNLGGSEAVFGAYAASIQKTGEEAYKNLGVSQSEYLATANKMGALFQGSGIEQRKSLELTEKAMQRAADMASVMGIDMSSAMEAVTGAAKGNFTMMDNLGVAMNATNIQAYALAKGLDFTWNTATQAEKAEVAMQMFFENTEQYAGNFARESTQTITGSIGLLQAALGSFTAGLGNANADMTNLTENLVDAFKAVVTNIVPVLENIVAALPTATGAILAAVADLLPMLLELVTNIFTQVLETILNLLPELIPAAVSALMTIVGALIDNLPLLINAAIELVTALVEGIGIALPQLIPAAVSAVKQIVHGLIENLPMLLDAALQLIIGLAQGLVDAIPQLVSALPTIIKAIVDFIIESIPQIIDAGIQLLTSLVTALPTIITAVVEAIPQIIDSIINAVIGSIPLIIDAGIRLLVSLIQALPQIITTVVGAIPKIVSSLVNAVIGNIDKIILAGVQLFVALIANLPTIIIEVVKAVPEIIAGLVTAIIESVPPVSTQISYRNLMDAVTELCAASDIGIKTVFTPATGIFTVTLYNGGNSQAVFSKEYENLTEQIYTESAADYANTALIGGEGEGAERTFVAITSGSGETRREIFVDAKDLRAEDFGTDYIDTLTFRGQSKLNEQAIRYSFDTSVNPHGNLTYKIDFDLGQTVKVISKSWGVSMTTRITEIEENYDADGQSISVVFGKSELTIAQKIRSDMSEVKTALSASTGISEVAEALSFVEETLGDLTEVDPKVQGDNVADTINNLFGKLPALEIIVGEGTISIGQYALHNMVPGDAFYFTSWSGNKFSDQPSDDGHVFLFKHSGDNTGNGYQRAMGFFISRNTMTFYVISVFVFNNPSGQANWLSFPLGALADIAAAVRGSTFAASINNVYNAPVSGTRIANGAVTTAKMAQEADTSLTYSLGSGVTMGFNMSFVNKGVVSIGMQINVGASGVPSGETILTITNPNFYPYSTVRSVATTVGGSGTSMPITINASGVVANAAASTLPTGFYLISCSYARA